MTNELKPCPFCPDGGTPCGGTHIDEGKGECYDYVECGKCGAKTGKHDSRESAVAAWNNRRNRTCENVYKGREFQCSECGKQWHLLERADSFDEWTHVRTPSFCPSCGSEVVDV